MHNIARRFFGRAFETWCTAIMRLPRYFHSHDNHLGHMPLHRTSNVRLFGRAFETCVQRYCNCLGTSILTTIISVICRCIEHQMSHPSERTSFSTIAEDLAEVGRGASHLPIWAALLTADSFLSRPQQPPLVRLIRSKKGPFAHITGELRPSVSIQSLHLLSIVPSASTEH